jgi:uncharacterized membrane protein YtjA (UPF0391 family)
VPAFCSIFSFANALPPAELQSKLETWPPELAFPVNVLSTIEIVKERDMGNLLYWAVIFLVVALVAGVLGFGGVAGTAAQGASLLFWIAIILFVVSLIAGLARRG